MVSSDKGYFGGNDATGYGAADDAAHAYDAAYATTYA